MTFLAICITSLTAFAIGYQLAGPAAGCVAAVLAYLAIWRT